MPCFESLFQILWTFGVFQHPRLDSDSSQGPEEGLLYPQERTFDLARRTSDIDPERTFLLHGLTFRRYIDFQLIRALSRPLLREGVDTFKSLNDLIEAFPREAL